MLNENINGVHSWLVEYINKCKSGEIIVGHEMILCLNRLVEHFDDPSITIDFKDAHKRIKFIETKCKHFEAPFAGKPFILELFQKAFIEAIYIFKIYDEEVEGLVRLYQEILYLVGRKNGKALDINTPIPTPTGWKRMSELDVGDYVFDEKGNATKIIRTSRIFTDHKCYKVTFEDGETIVADANHVWTVMTKNSRRVLNYEPKSDRKLLRPDYRDNNGYFDITTEKMVNDFVRVRKDGKGKEYKYRVPMNEAVKYKEKDLLVSPYTLGVWLGDGESSDARVTVNSKDIEIIQYLKDDGIDISIENGADINLRIRLKNKKNTEYCRRGHLKSKHTGTNGTCLVCEKELRRARKAGTERPKWDSKYITIKEQLKELGVLNNKHIPNIYLHSSIEQRMELLKGLMDTDGYADKRGQCEFVQKSKIIINNFSELLSSLGIKHTIREKTAKCNGKEVGTVYSVLFYCDKTNSCFKLKRKHERLKGHLAPRMKNKSIIDVAEIESVQTKCIGVDSPNNLYLAGERMTVTHNSPLISAICLAEWFCGERGTKILCSSNDYEQADIMFQAIDSMREESSALEKVTRSNIKGIFFGNPRKKKTKGKFSYANKGSIRKISAKTGAKEGRNIKVGAVDEAHEMKDNSLVMPIRQALSTQDEPLYFELTTEGMVNNGYLDERLKDARKVLYGEMERPRWLIWMYTQDNEQEIWQDEKTWFKSNPGLGTIKKWSFLRGMIEEAKTNKATRAFVLSKDFNIKQNNSSAWLTPDDIENKEAFDLEEFRNGFGIGGVDLARSGDLCSARVMLMKPGEHKKYFHQQYFIPESKIEKLPREDRPKFEKWIRDELITVSPGNENDFNLVTKWFINLYKSYGIRVFLTGYDKWSAVYFVKDMEEYEFDMERVTQDHGTLSNPYKMLEADLKSNLVIYNDNPIDKWCLENAALNINSKQEILIVKPEGKPENKIDGTVTMGICYKIYFDHRTEFLSLIGR